MRCRSTLARLTRGGPAFRDVLLADPCGVVAEVVGFDIPDTVQVVLQEESLTQIHLTISAAEDLSDADLGVVAGGGGWGSRFSGRCPT